MIFTFLAFYDFSLSASFSQVYTPTRAETDRGTRGCHLCAPQWILRLISDQFAHISLFSLQEEAHGQNSRRLLVIFLERALYATRHLLWILALLLRLRETENCEKETLDFSVVSDIQNKPQRRRRGSFFSISEEKYGFIHMALWMFTGFSLAFSG